MQSDNKYNEVEIEEENVPDPFFVAMTRARYIVLSILAVFFILAALKFLAYWPAIICALLLCVIVIISNWPKELSRLPEVVPSGVGEEAKSVSKLIKAVPDPIMSLDSSGNIIIFNEAADLIMGELLQGQHISSVIRAPNVLDAIELVKNGSDAIRVGYEVRGEIERNFDVYITSLYDNTGALISDQGELAVLLVLSDLTTQERIESMRADFVANVSHELRTPVASLLGFIETIKGSAKNDAAAQDKFLDIMHDQAERMTRLINDLLSLSRIEMNVHQPPSGRVDLKSIIDHVVDVLLPVAKNNNVVINLKIDTEDTTIAGERDELVQVFQNLIENAIKYGGKGKNVDVLLQDIDGGKLSASIRDYGPGIAPEDLPRLTERFYRVDVLESREKGGTGLGLAIVKHILNRHRAQFAIKSNLGEGSNFTITFLREHS